MDTPPRNPNSPPSREDDEISLDELDDRAQQRPRLPGQKRDKRQFEMSAPSVPERQTEELSGPAGIAPLENVVEAPSPDDIETYDPSTVDTTAAPRTESNEPAAPVKVTLQPTPGLDDLDEFIARTSSEGPQADKPVRERRPYTLVEKVCFGCGLLILLGLGVWLVRAVASEANGVAERSRPWPKLPMKGSLITVKEAKANWRMRKKDEILPEMAIIMPLPKSDMPEVIPQVVFSVEDGQSGYLRFVFWDSYGTEMKHARGNNRIVRVENGHLKDDDTGKSIMSGSEGSVNCLAGLESVLAYHSYVGKEDLPRWRVQVAENSDPKGKGEDWKVLGTFDVRNELVK